MAKINDRPKEEMQLTIEFADNGIILRNPECEDDVTLAVHPQTGYSPHGIDFTEEYKAIGKTIYDWLKDVVVYDHSSKWIATGAEFYIVATLTGRRYG
jgi:hypothetical protein